MRYCVAIAALCVVVGEALERALHLAGRATRWAWVAALAGSYLVPAAGGLRARAVGAPPVPPAPPLRPRLHATRPLSAPRPPGRAAAPSGPAVSPRAPPGCSPPLR